MIFADDLTVREPNDAEVKHWAGSQTLLTGQRVADHLRKGYHDFRQVLVPDRMKHLPRDPRGYPIPYTVLRDAGGKAHFTINETRLTWRVLQDDLCAICGKPLQRGRWFIGGPGSAFHQDGAYIDPPAHRECARYALYVCPYLAMPNYGRLIDGRTLANDAPVRLFRDERQDMQRPELFVAVHARKHKFELEGQQTTVRPARPYIAVEYWQHGYPLAREHGEALCRLMGYEP